MRVAVAGCGHGELDKMYESMQFIEQRDGIKIDLFLCCGDFQACRNEGDLACVAMPQKYRKMNTFYKYYSGEKRAPILTIFIGGNHEASNYLLELFHGGWVAPNIWYMGHAGVVNLGGIRIGGLSGIHKNNHYHLGHYESPPFTEDTMRSIYHVREFDVHQLMQMSDPIDIFMSHDWPQGIYYDGDHQGLVRKKNFFKEEVQEGSLGSPAAKQLLEVLKPRFWFSAHLHVKFSAAVRHGGNDGPITRFVALDKCLNNRDFLQILDFPEASKGRNLCYDEEWLAIMRRTNHILSTSQRRLTLPRLHPNDLHPRAEERKWVRDKLKQKFKLGPRFGTDLEGYTEDDDEVIYEIARNFVATAPAYDGKKPAHTDGKKRPTSDPIRYTSNPQSQLLLEMLEMKDVLGEAFDSDRRVTPRTPSSQSAGPGAHNRARPPFTSPGMSTPDSSRVSSHHERNNNSFMSPDPSGVLDYADDVDDDRPSPADTAPATDRAAALADALGGGDEDINPEEIDLDAF